jgi:muramoyltetrapeptide carboxypeptidase
MSIIIPPYLRQGDTVGLICPAGYMSAERTQTCIAVLTSWGYKVKVGKTVGHQFHYFSGTDAERLADLQDMLDDSDVHAILCARGGYGTSRIIDDINWKKFKQQPKWIIGYSDITVLHCHLFQRLKTASLHAPMAGAFVDAGGEDAFTLTLKNALSGESLKYEAPFVSSNRTGRATGALIGGNLSLIAHLTGTPSMPDTNGAILFLEDIGEYLYNIDRMLLQLDRAEKLNQLGGLIIGGFTDIKDTTIPFGQNIHELIQNRISTYDFPVAFDFPVSHTNENVALRIGMKHTMVVNNNGTTLKSVSV